MNNLVVRVGIEVELLHPSYRGPLPTAEEDQQRAYERQMQTYAAAMDVWRDDGGRGPPPPRPVRPHTPGRGD